jgi:thiamine biosynthesis lipoprotein
MLPPGVRIDPGGIGKGLAGDMVAGEMLAAGAAGVLIDLGGDLRVAGVPPDGNAWTISIEDPFDPERELTRVALLDGAVVTTSITWRKWEIAGRKVHHIVDPSTGDISASDVVSATVVAGEGWWGEALAKAAFLAGMDEGANLVAASGATGVLVDCSGRVREIDGFDSYKRLG